MGLFGIEIAIFRTKQTDWSPYLHSLGQWTVMIHYNPNWLGSKLHPGYAKDEPIRSVHFKLENGKENL